VYERHREYFDFVMKKSREKSHIETIPRIIISRNETNPFNSTHLITDFLSQLGLNVDHFIQRPDRPFFKKVIMIYETAMKHEQWTLSANGYKVVDQKNEICALCDSLIQGQGQGQEHTHGHGSMVQCGECGRYSHSKCYHIEFSVCEDPGCLCVRQYVCELVC
jgi:hypothetical protein